MTADSNVLNLKSFLVTKQQKSHFNKIALIIITFEIFSFGNGMCVIVFTIFNDIYYEKYFKFTHRVLELWPVRSHFGIR